MQESSHLVVMLTTVMERGRPKCHQYWPIMGDELSLGNGFSVTCKTEQADETGSFVFRELVLCDTKTNETRSIQHMQYLVWPDHGVPSDPNLFLQFTEKVRSARNTTLLQEIEASLRQVRLLDVDADEENGQGVDICERRVVHSKRKTTKSENGVNDDQITDNETNSDNGGDSSPEQLDIPPSTSVHQYVFLLLLNYLILIKKKSCLNYYFNYFLDI